MYKKLRNFRTVPPGVTNLVSKCAGNLKEKSHERRVRNFEWYRRTVKKTTGGGGHNGPPPPGKLGSKANNLKNMQDTETYCRADNHKFASFPEEC